MSIEERDDLNPEEDPGMRRESEDVEGHASHTRDAATRLNADDEEGDDDVEAHSSKNR